MPSASAPATASGTGNAERLHQVAAGHHRADADRADGEVHAAGREHHHLRKADDDVDRERAADREEVEGGQEAGRARGEDDPEERDDDERARAAAEAPAEIETPPHRRLSQDLVRSWSAISFRTLTILRREPARGKPALAAPARLPRRGRHLLAGQIGVLELALDVGGDLLQVVLVGGDGCSR